MLFFYIRHGDPIYDPDSLTPLGHRQAEAIGKRLAIHGIDKIYASTSTRAQLTAKPACEMLKTEAELVDFANEGHAWGEFTAELQNGSRTWLFYHPDARKKFVSEEIIKLGHNWCDHPDFAQYRKGVERLYRDSDAFFASLGYEHIRGTGTYKVIKPNNSRVALFAHQGFCAAFFSTLFDIPYPIYSMHFDICHTGMSVIDFKEENGIAIPVMLTHSSDAHLYREGLPTKYNGNHTI